MLGNLYDGVKHKKYLGNTVAGKDASAVTSDAIDCQGYARARVTMELGAVTDTAVLKGGVTGCATSAGTYTSLADLGTDGVLATGKSDNAVVFDVSLEGIRYIKYTYQRLTANIEFDSLTVDLYGASLIPTTDDTSVWKEIVK